MLRDLYPVQVEVKRKRITISRLYFRQFLRNLSKLFGVASINQIPLFGIVEASFFNSIFYFTFDEFFVPEIYLIFKELYEKFGTKEYLQVCMLLVEKTWIKSVFDENIPKPDNIDEKLSQLKSTLMPYQRAYIDKYFEAKHKLQLRGGMLAFDQGLGKTITSLALAHVIDPDQVIVICPLTTVISVWKNNILGHVHSNSNIGIVGHSAPKPYKYVLCGYERIAKIEPYLKKNNKFVMIVDESHNFRYLNTQRTQNLLQLRENYKIEDVVTLSGTPIKALASELIPMLMLLDPKFTRESTIKAFAKIYNQYRVFAYHVLQYRLGIMMERKLKTEELELPQKHPPETIKLKVPNSDRYTIKVIKKEIIDYAVKRIQELTKDIKKNIQYLDALLQTCIGYKILTKEEAQLIHKVCSEFIGLSYYYMSDKNKRIFDEFRKVYNRLMADLKKINPTQAKLLQQLRASTLGLNSKAFGEAMGRVFTPRFQEAIKVMYSSNRKQILSIVDNAIKKTVMFSTSAVALEYIHNDLQSIGYQSVFVSGKSDVVTDLQNFKKSNTRLLLATVQKLSTGVDLLEANTCIFLNAPYRDADFRQAQDRIYRYGQDTEVFIYMLTIDTGNEQNIITHSKIIMDWSKEISEALLRQDKIEESVQQSQYERPYTVEEIRKIYPDKADELLKDPVHRWRAETGIELIHEEPTYEEQMRIWFNWNLMNKDYKRISDDKSIELFEMDNRTHHYKIIRERYSDYV